MVYAPTQPLKPPPGIVTEEQFYSFIRACEGHQLWEQVNGEIKAMGEPSGKHESLQAWLLFQLQSQIYAQNLPLAVHSRILCCLDLQEKRRPDILVVDREVWRRNTQREAILTEPPELVIEIVSTHWQEDYQKKALWYAAFGVKEYWIADLLLKLEDYPARKHPDIDEPTLSIGSLVGGAYQFQRFTGSTPIASQLFLQLHLSVEQMVAAANA